MDSDGDYTDEPAGLSHAPEGGDAYVAQPAQTFHGSAEPEVVPDDDPVGPCPDPVPMWWPHYTSPYAWYKDYHGDWRKRSRYNSLMTPSEVPADWTLQDRVRAYLTLNAFAPKGNYPSGSPEY